jgi:lysophospholipid acyltransferase (LPLAT)-like uncharacterized protein
MRDLSAALLGFGYASFLRLKAASWRLRSSGVAENIDAQIAAGRPMIAVFWHGSYVPLFVLLRGRHARIFTSDSFRGRVIRAICRSYGYDAVLLADHARDQSIERLRAGLRECSTAAIAIDGPLGPRHAVKRGAIQMAAELGFCLVPVGVAADRSRSVEGRWDRMEIPRWFARVGLVAGEPLVIPPAAATDPEPWKAVVASQIDRAMEEAGRLSGRRS